MTNGATQQCPCSSLNLPKKFGIVLFPTFQSLDVFGPLDAFQFLSTHVEGIEIYLLSNTLDPVSTRFSDTKFPGSPPSTVGFSVVPTHTYDNAPEDIDVLFVPGGLGTRAIGEQEQNILVPIRDLIKKRFSKIKYLLTVCTGSALAAQAGVLDGYKATSNKSLWHWVITQGPNVNWVPVARWTVDGENDKIWTSSGVQAGMDMSLAWIAHVYSEDVATKIANSEEYMRNIDPTFDPFAKIHGLGQREI